MLRSILSLGVVAHSSRVFATFEDQDCSNPLTGPTKHVGEGCFTVDSRSFSVTCSSDSAWTFTEFQQGDCVGEGLVLSSTGTQCAKIGSQYVQIDCGASGSRRKLAAKPTRKKKGKPIKAKPTPPTSVHRAVSVAPIVEDSDNYQTPPTPPYSSDYNAPSPTLPPTQEYAPSPTPLPPTEGWYASSPTPLPPTEGWYASSPTPLPPTDGWYAPSPTPLPPTEDWYPQTPAPEPTPEPPTPEPPTPEPPTPEPTPKPFVYVPPPVPAPVPPPAKPPPRNCRVGGTKCTDNLDASDSCHLTCCSRMYKQGPRGYDVCVEDDRNACWKEGKVCWDNDGQDSCKWNCCSGRWTNKNGADRCDKPVMGKGITGYSGKPDGNYQQTLTIANIPCWSAGTKCWNNDGRDSCWLNCCSKSYYHNGKTDVCAPLPTDGKCFAQYTPCWDAYPVPQGNYYNDVQRQGSKQAYPSCFQCCARVAKNGATRWPAWTEYYIGNGRHDINSQKTHWWDSLVAGIQNVDPTGMLEQFVPVNGQARGGNDMDGEVVGKLAEELVSTAVEKAASLGPKAVAGLAGPLGTGAGMMVGFLTGAIEQALLPQWDLCD